MLKKLTWAKKQSHNQNSRYELSGDYGSFLGDFHRLDIKTMTWSEISDSAMGSAPTARMAYGFLSDFDKLYLFGGQSQKGICSET